MLHVGEARKRPFACIPYTLFLDFSTPLLIKVHIAITNSLRWSIKPNMSSKRKINRTPGCLLYASILVDSVGPPSAEICRTATNFS